VLGLIAEPAAEALAAVEGRAAVAVDPLLVAIGVGLVVAIVAIRFVTLRPSAGSASPGSAASGAVASNQPAEAHR
jgi:hypothetical protein